MVNGSVFCVTPTSRRSGHVPFMQTGAETSSTCVVAIESNPPCQLRIQEFWSVPPVVISVYFWTMEQFAMASGLTPAAILQAVLGRAILAGCFGDESAESRSALQLFCIPPHFCFCRQINLWVEQHRYKMGVSTWDGVHSHSMGVSTEWNRCPGSMARRARDSVAPLRGSSAGWMPASIERLFTGVGRKHPVTIRKASLVAGQWGRCEHCGTRQEPSTLLLNGPG